MDGLSIELLSTLHAGMSERNPWSQFLSAMRRETGAKAATLILQPTHVNRPHAVFTETGSDEAPHRDTYRQSFWRIDPFVDLPPDTVLTMDEFLGGMDNLRANAFFEGHLGPADISHILGIDFVVSSQVSCRFRLSRSTGAGPFGQEERALCAAILPHLRSATQIFQRLAAAESERSFFGQMLERLRIGVLIVDQKRRILSMNETAADILRDRDGIGGDHATLTIGDRRSARVAHDAIAGICDGGDGDADGKSHIIRIERPSGRPAIGMVVKSMPASRQVDVPLERCAFVLLSDPERSSEAEAQPIMELWALTRAESLLSTELLRGLSLDEASDELGISRNTARAHLRSIFAKTGVHRQSELSRLLMNSVAKLI